MIKGINKRVVVIKNPDSDFIEEAYFILRNGADSNPKGAPEGRDIVAEANKLIADYHDRRLIMECGISEKKHAEIEEFLKSPAKRPIKKDSADSSSLSGWSETEKFISDFDTASDVNKFYERGCKKLLAAGNTKKLFGLNPPPSGFFIGAATMSAIVIIARFIEFLMIR